MAREPQTEIHNPLQMADGSEPGLCASCGSCVSGNGELTYNNHLEHLITLASESGWKEYAWRRANEMDADKSGLWSGIAKDLQMAMLSKKDVVKKNGDQQK